jgi:hypothetical protein
MSSLGSDGLNILDGGTFISKLLVEFGIIGALLIGFYLKLLFSIIKKVKNNLFKTPQELFYYACFITFSIVIFARGAGYFTPSFFLFITSLFSIYTNKKYPQIPLHS